MNTTLASALRLATLAAALTFITAGAAAKDYVSTDRAAQTLALNGRLTVQNAGPNVEVGTFQIQVSTKLGQPSAKLNDGTWLYQGYHVEDSDAQGTLAIRFNKGCVSELTLVTPAVATAMMAPKPTGEKILVATNR